MTPLSITKSPSGDADERAKEIKKLHEQIQESKMRSIASEQTSIENQQPLPALTQNLSAQQNETAEYNK